MQEALAVRSYTPICKETPILVDGDDQISLIILIVRIESFVQPTIVGLGSRD
jgi:hypothetical protein